MAEQSPSGPRADWGALATLRRLQAQAARQGDSRWVLWFGCLPAVVAGYVAIAVMVARLLPTASLPPESVLSLTALAIVARGAARGLEAGGPSLPRAGLTQLLVAPLDRRALLARWVVDETFATGVVSVGVLAWLGVVLFGPWGALAHAGALAFGTVACAACAVGARGVLGIGSAYGPGGARRVVRLAALAVWGAAAAVVCSAIVGAEWVAAPAVAPWIAVGDWVAAPLGLAMSAAVPDGWWLAAAAAATAAGLLPVWLAPAADGLHLLEAASEPSDRRVPARRMVRAAGGPAPGVGRGTGAWWWKAMVERTSGATALPPWLSWAGVCAAGVGLAWWWDGAADLGAPLAVVAAVVVFGAPAGGRGTPGLFAELAHPAWLLRAPGEAGRTLAALLAPPVLRLVVVAALLSLPLAWGVPGGIVATLAALAAGAVMVWAAHLGRACCWLAEPPWNPTDAQAAVVEVRALALPPGLGVSIAAAVWIGGEASPVLACALGAAPAALLAWARWNSALALWHRLEVAPRVAADRRAP